MNKIIIAFLLFSLLLPLTIAPPTAEVTFPNGGELLSGTRTIIWNASSSEISQDLNARISYSWNPGTEDHEIADANLLDFCDFEIEEIWAISDLNVQSLFDYMNQAITNDESSVVYFEDEWILFVTNGSGSVHAYTYNQGSELWAVDLDLNAGFIASGILRASEFFVLDGSLYGLGSAGGTGTEISAVKYNTVSDKWEVNYDINKGLPERTIWTYVLNYYAITDYFPTFDWLIRTESRENSDFSSVVNSYKWDGIGVGWVEDNRLATDFNLHFEDDSAFSYGGSDVFVKDGTLYALLHERGYSPYGDGNVYGARYDQSVSKWVFDSDINKSLYIPDETPHNFATSFAVEQFKGDGQYSVIISWSLSSPPQPIGATIKDFKETFRTDVNTTCEYEWDTTSVLNSQYYLDVNIFDWTNMSMILDSSDDLFTILNWTDSDISCECVSNCSSCNLDVNEFVVVPINEENNIKIKVTNNPTIKNIGFRIDNSINNDKQYFIYTSGNDTDFSFNDTITYGSTVSNGVQKIWKQPESGTPFFRHSFIDIVNSNEEKYYDIRLRSPMFSWASMVNNIDWDTSFIPQKSDANGHSIDQYQVSSYSNIRNELIETIPNISGSLNSGNYVFQLNAKVGSSTGTILAGEVVSKGTNPTTSASISTKETRFNFSSISKGILSMISSETTSKLYILSDYALLQRGFFTKEFDILDKHGDPLELYVDDVNVVRNYLIEGQQFKVKGQLYDRENSIDFMEVEVFLEVNNDTNKVLYKKIDIGEISTTTEQFIDYDIDLEGIFDLTANTLIYRDLLVKIKVTDSDSNYSEVQHGWIKLRQFPFLPGDLLLGIDLINKLKSEHPAGRITLQSNSPEAIRGLNFRFLSDDVELPNSDFNITLYKGTDFDCIGEDCSFDFEIDDWIFPHYGFWRFNVSVLLTTQDEDLNNSRTNKTINFYVNFKKFKMAKIVETRERENHDYKPTERIPLVMVLEDSDGADLRNQLNVYITVEDCNSASEEAGIENSPGCWAQSDLNYTWKEHLYDELTGINYYFFESVMVKNAHTTFSDTNYMRVVGHVQDAKNQHTDSDFNPLLATKCKSNVNTNCHALDVICLIGSALTSVLEYGLGCSTENGKIITWDVNGSQEGRIDWDSTKSSGAPNTECFLCMNADNNNVYRNNLEQDLLCAGWYTIGEQNIDKLVFRLGNRSSDYSEQNDDLKQYLEMTIPYSLIYYNDPILLKKGLELKFATGSCAEIGTLGELVWCGFNDLFTGVGNPLSDVFSGATATGAITNIGSDCNFNNAFDPNFLDGVFFVKVDGLKVTNMVDYWDVDESIKDSDSSRFFKTLRDLDIEKKQETTRITFYGNDLEVFKTEEVQSNLVINELYSDIDIIEANIDPNSILPNYKTLPSILKFNILLDLVYNDETAYIRRAVPIFITTIITPQFGSADAIRRGIEKGLNEFLDNPVDTLLMIPFDTILNLEWWAEGGWFWIFIMMIAVTLFILYRGSRSG